MAFLNRSTPKIFLIDGNSCIWRSYYAIKADLVSPQGEKTKAIYGFRRLIENLLTRELPTGLAVVFDTKWPTFRNDLYKDYKSRRPGMPEDLFSQLGKVKEMLKAYNIAILESPGFEADDILATAALFLKKRGYLVFIVSEDKDLHQIVDREVQIYSIYKKGRIYDYSSVVKEWGVEPEKIKEIIGLSGDYTDDIPGIPGIGKKIALNLIREYGDIEGVFANLDKINSGKLKQNLVTFKEQAYLSRKLATLDTTVPLEIKEADFLYKEPDRQRLHRLCKRWGFKD